MEESREMQKLHGFLQCTIYLMVLTEIVIFVYAKAPFLGIFLMQLLRSAVSRFITICFIASWLR